MVGPGYIFGDIDLYRECNFSHSMVCVEKGSEVYIINRENFQKIFKNNDSANQIFKTFVEEKE